MSVATLTIPRTQHTFAHTETEQLRKRTYSFSSPSTAPPPAKLQRTRMGSSLRRSESMVLIPSEPSASSSSSNYTFTNTTTLTPQQQLALQRCKEQRIRRKAQLAAAGSPPTPISTQPLSTLRRTSSSASLLFTTPKPRRRPAPTTTPRPPAQIILPSLSNPITQYVSRRLTSPLSPAPRQSVPMNLPCGLARSSTKNKGKGKSGENLYVLAIKQSMSTSPFGQKVLYLGARMAQDMDDLKNAALLAEDMRRSIAEATRDLERLVEGTRDMEVEMEVEMDVQDYVMAEAELLAPEPSTPTPALSVSPTSLATPILTTKPWLHDEIDWEFITRPALVECAA